MLTIRLISRARYQLTRRTLCLLGLASVFSVGALRYFWTSASPLPILARLNRPGGTDFPLVFSPDGSTLVTATAEGRVSLWDVVSRRVRSSTELAGSYPYKAVFSPNGSLLAICIVKVPAKSYAVVVIDTSDGSIQTTLDNSGLNVIDLTFSEGSSHFSVIASQDSNSSELAHVWQFRTWTTDNWIEQPAQSITMPVTGVPATAAISRDGKTIAINNTDKAALTIWDLTVPSPTMTTLGGTAAVNWPFYRPPCFSRDGTTLIAHDGNGNIEVWDVASKSLRVSYPTSPNLVAINFSLSSDQKTLVTCEPEKDLARGLTAKLDSLVRYAVTRGRYEGAPSRVVVRDLATGKVRATLEDQVRAVMTSDGKALATVNHNGTLTVWDLSPP